MITNFILDTEKLIYLFGPRIFSNILWQLFDAESYDRDALIAQSSPQNSHEEEALIPQGSMDENHSSSSRKIRHTATAHYTNRLRDKPLITESDNPDA